MTMTIEQLELLSFGTTRRAQGQIVTESWAYAWETQTLVCRRHDRSDRSTVYYLYESVDDDVEDIPDHFGALDDFSPPAGWDPVRVEA
jgi:hypothetical protein